MRSVLTMAVVALASRAALAQNITVQQPVVRNFSVGTTVVAPDRGGAYVGGVRRSFFGHTRPGIFRNGANMGREVEGATVSTHVWIHDLHGMDEAILAQMPGEQPEFALSTDAEHAVRTLHARSQKKLPTPLPQVATAAKPAPPKTEVRKPSPVLAQAYRARAEHLAAQGKVDLAQKYFDLARQASR